MSSGTEGYDYWLFDLDGTLVDTRWSYKREVFDRVGAELGQTFSDREAHALWHGLGVTSRDALLEEWGFDPEAFWSVFDRLDDPIDRAEATYLYEDAAPVADLDDVGLVTHCPAEITAQVLDRLDVRDWFDTVVCCSADLGWKPDPAPVELAARELGAGDADLGALAGDSEGDVGAAWNAGLDGIHVERHGHDERGRCVLGDYRVEALTDLDTLPTE